MSRESADLIPVRLQTEQADALVMISKFGELVLDQRGAYWLGARFGALLQTARNLRFLGVARLPQLCAADVALSTVPAAVHAIDRRGGCRHHHQRHAVVVPATSGGGGRPGQGVPAAWQASAYSAPARDLRGDDKHKRSAHLGFVVETRANICHKLILAQWQEKNMTRRAFTDQLVVESLQLWCDNVVRIGRIHSEGGDVVAAVTQILSDNYDYDKGKVLFKPTLAFGPHTYRPTKEGALAYFIGGNPDFPNDKGFKLKPWVRVWFNKLDYVLHGDLAIAQCNVYLVSDDDSHIFVNKSFVFKICDDGRVRIVLHQSSLPFQPKVQ